MPTTRRKAPPPPEEEQQIGPDEEQIPDDTVRERARSPKDKKLQEAIAGIYIMIGGALQALPVAALGPRGKEIGKSLLLHADSIASAWIDLAEDDKRVRRILEGFTQFSGWGKVIGLHLEAIGGGMPGVVGARPQPQQQRSPMPNLGDLETLMGLGDLFRQQATEEKMNRPEQPNSPLPQNGPPQPDPEVVRQYMANMAAAQQAQQQQQVNQQPRVRQAGPAAGFAAGRNAGIPSPTDLLKGQQPIPDPGSDEFPTSGSDNLNK